MTDSPILYFCPQTRAETALWMNEEVGAPCDIEPVNIRKEEQKTAEFVAKNPMGKLPVLRFGEMVTTETAAICAFLADHYADYHLAPSPGSLLRGPYYRWMFFAPSCMEPAMLDIFSGSERENPASAGHGAVSDVLSAVDHVLSEGPYLLGTEFTAADIVFGSTLSFAMMFGAFEKKDLYTTYVSRLMERPAAIRARNKSAEIAKTLEGFGD